MSACQQHTRTVGASVGIGRGAFKPSALCSSAQVLWAPLVYCAPALYTQARCWSLLPLFIYFDHLYIPFIELELQFCRFLFQSVVWFGYYLMPDLYVAQFAAFSYLCCVPSKLHSCSLNECLVEATLNNCGHLFGFSHLVH